LRVQVHAIEFGRRKNNSIQFNSVSTTLIKLTHLITEFSSQDDDEYIKPMMMILNFKV